jgi:hypothetical protein
MGDINMRQSPFWENFYVSLPILTYSHRDALHSAKALPSPSGVSIYPTFSAPKVG